MTLEEFINAAISGSIGGIIGGFIYIALESWWSGR